MQGQLTEAEMAARQAKMRSLIEAAADVECECGGKLFKEATKAKKISALDPNNDTGQEQFMNVPSLYCISCKKELELEV